MTDTIRDDEFENERDVGKLRRQMRDFLAEIKRLKSDNKLLRAGMAPNPGPPADESPRAKFIRENVYRLKSFEKGTPEWQAEVDKILAEAQPLMDAEIAAIRERQEAEIGGLRQDVERETVRVEVRRLASSMAKAGCAEILLPHLAPRVRAVWRDGKCATELVDSDGTALSEAALSAEFRETRREFVGIVEGASSDDKAAQAKRLAQMLGKDPKPAQQLTREQFNKLPPHAQAAAMRDGAPLLEH